MRLNLLAIFSGAPCTHELMFAMRRTVAIEPAQCAATCSVSDYATQRLLGYFYDTAWATSWMTCFRRGGTLQDTTRTPNQQRSSPPESTRPTVILFLPVLRRLILTSCNEYSMLPRTSPATRANTIGLSQLLHEKLHWLDVRERVTFKLVVMVHRCLNGRAPQYRSLCPTVQPETSLFRRAKSTARTTSPTQHVQPPGFCHCWSVRLEQSSGLCPPFELQRSCFLGACWRQFCSHGTSAASALSGSTGDVL